MSLKTLILTAAPAPLCSELVSGTLSLATHWGAPLQIFLNALVIPAYLSFIGVRKLLYHDFLHGTLSAVILILIQIIVLFEGYATWGILTGALLRPDDETLLLLTAEFMVGAAVLIVPMLLAIMARIAQSLRRG